jgi:alpha-L-rhamnosidase
MISFNHYAYGAVIDWVYRNVAGLAPAIDEPGYRKIVVAPKPAEGFTFAEASINTRLGVTSIHWAVQSTGDLAIKLVVPFGASANLQLPTTASSQITINGVRANNGAAVSHGEYVIVVSNPEIVNYK